MPPEPRRVLASYLVEAAAAAPGLRWVPPANLHLTLRFLGWVTPDLVERVSAGVSEIHEQPFGVRLGAMGTFGGGRVRVVWLGLEEGAEAAGLLAQRLEAVCRAAGAEPEPRPFRAHLTLARSRARLGAELPALPALPGLSGWNADRVLLYRSRLGAGGANYEPLLEVRLSP